jgi:hypothetical protein
MRYIYTTCLFVLLTALIARAGDPPVDRDGRPLITKLGTIAVDIVENSPVVFNDKLYIFMGRHTDCFSRSHPPRLFPVRCEQGCHNVHPDRYSRCR